MASRNKILTDIVEKLNAEGYDENNRNDLLLALLAYLPGVGSGSFEFNRDGSSPLALADTWQTVIDWEELLTPSGVSVDSLTGIFTLEVGSRWYFPLERVYINEDQSPSSVVILGIRSQISEDGGQTWMDGDFERHAPIGAATSPQEPATASFTTPFLFDAVTVPLQIRLQVMATDDGSAASSAYLLRMKTSPHIIAIVPQ